MLTGLLKQEAEIQIKMGTLCRKSLETFPLHMHR